MMNIRLSALLIYLFGHSTNSEGDEPISFLLCYQNYLQCNTLEPYRFSSFEPGKVFPFYTQKTIDGGCRYLDKMVNCHYDTSEIRGCEEYFKSNETYISLADTFVQRVCQGEGRKDIESFLTCANKQKVQVEFLIAFHFINGYIAALQRSRYDQGIMKTVCRKLEGQIDNLMHSISYECGAEDVRRFYRVLQLFSDSQAEILSLIYAPGNPSNCTFLDMLTLHQ